MRWAIYLLNLGPFADPQAVLDLACLAEEAGWDGFFLADNLQAEPGVPLLDTWTTLAAIASQTRRIRLGPLVTAIPRRHLAKLAREAVTVDHLSGGRLIQGVGSGDDHWREYSTFGMLPDDRQRGAMLDEGLTVLTGLWSGQPFSFEGDHYQVANGVFTPGPLQQPRIPIWVAGKWPHKGPFRRAARWDGVCPNALERPVSPEEYTAIGAFITTHRTSAGPFDVVHTQIVQQPGRRPSEAQVAAYQDAGVTWWLEYFDGTGPMRDVERHIRHGPRP
ncbi:MAG TPA: LLM class flavin-dependent oxidoreductase [Chloroflexia bacterium]|nr:LLM class flavin-dependent oxidoreductase [Chloroflexia bacterium]